MMRAVGDRPDGQRLRTRATSDAPPAASDAPTLPQGTRTQGAGTRGCRSRGVVLAVGSDRIWRLVGIYGSCANRRIASSRCTTRITARSTATFTGASRRDPMTYRIRWRMYLPSRGAGLTRLRRGSRSFYGCTRWRTVAYCALAARTGGGSGSSLASPTRRAPVPPLLGLPHARRRYVTRSSG